MNKNYLLVDFRDSFTNNLAALLIQCGIKIDLVMYDKITTVQSEKYDGLILSPGPGHPKDYPDILMLLEGFKDKQVLGVCLGFQILAHYSGVNVAQTQTFPIHGRVLHMEIYNRHSRFFAEKVKGDVILYNSLGVVSSQKAFSANWLSLGERLGIVLAAESLYFNWLGFQFHPESYRTTIGVLLLQRFFRKGAVCEAE